MADILSQRLAVDLAEAARNGAHEEVAEVVTMLSGSGSRHVSAAVVSELAGLCACAVAAHCPSAGAGTAFGVLIENELAVTVGVDALPPGLRAALRALLAALNDDHCAQEIQADLATRGGRDEVALVLAHCLLWLLELAEAPLTDLPSLSCFAT
jgi:hypothetical protein